MENVQVTIWLPFWIRLFTWFIKSVIHDNSIRSRAIIVIMDLFLILTQFSYIMYTRERGESNVTTKFNITINMVANMTAFGHISDTEVTFQKISVIVIQIKNILCELIITFFIGTSQITFHIISHVILIIDLYTRAQKEYASTNSIKCQKALMHITKKIAKK